MNILIVKHCIYDTKWNDRNLSTLYHTLIEHTEHDVTVYPESDDYSTKYQMERFKNHLEHGAIDKIILIPKDNDWEDPTFSMSQRRICNLFTTEQEICYTIYTKRDGNTYIYQLDTCTRSPILGTRDSIFKGQTSLPTFISQTIIYETE